ncbi:MULTISPECIES: FecCD family ABC transporter permease [Bacillus]|uniref:Iron-siderophore ABC transporter permease n=2 Tax=Bacillus TaxID=1386 RepID=A0A0M5JDX4_9BACI|nr:MULTISPECIES: iron ABC transporter permease [Bacillus]ALC81369.1 iron-siderophore ABC transporter permease [Bacillus gobiensis]MBP1080391.1 iron complex transport system permease protein [Bacillus capparidis]MED1094250.1 iron ABC transporter permease [Bacillus capparidis]
MDPHKKKIVICLLSLFFIIILFFYLSLKIGAFSYSFSSIIHFLFSGETSKESIVFNDVRLPRAVITAVIGANLAVAGALMQILTKNPLASPSVFGINAGASFTVVSFIVFIPGIMGWPLLLAAFLGGFIAAALIFLISSILKGGNLEVKVALTGVAIQALLSSCTQGLLLFNEDSAQNILVWLAGTVAGTKWEDVFLILPVSLIALIVSFCLAGPLSVLALGDDVARGLGQRIFILKAAAGFLVVVLAGASVAAVGPIGFVGLITPHVVRYIAGTDYRVILPLSALFGGALLLAADVMSRFIAFPYETPVGIVTALIGAPYFIYLAKFYKKRRSFSRA